jgi:hypothetical protein
MTISGRHANTRGRAAENALAAWLQANGFPDAERSASKLVDRGDIAGVPGTCIEIKHCNDPMRALRDAQREALAEAFGRRPVAVVRLPGVTDAGSWWAATPYPVVVSHQVTRIDFIVVADRCPASKVHAAIGECGGALRGGWWLTTVERLFSTLKAAS